MEISKVPLPDVWHLRQTVMYPDESIDFVKLEQDEWGLHWGIYEQRQLVSVVSVFVQGRQVQFRKFATRTDRQGRGYGKALLQYVMHWAKEHGMQSIWCNARLSATAHL